MSGRKRLSAVFWATDQGHEPVREWLKSLPKTDCRAIGKDILRVQEYWPIGMPLVKGLGNGLWEVRSKITDGIARVFFCIDDGEIILLHGFVKKTQRTPKNEIDTARKRKQQWDQAKP